jgi:hypothetical protein
VLPPWQATGRGSALLAHHRQYLDATGTPAYLEASSPRSRDLYTRFGYRAAGQAFRLPDGPAFWPMWRQPHPAITPTPQSHTAEPADPAAQATASAVAVAGILADAGIERYLRSPAAIRHLLDGWEPLAPGLVSVATWRPETNAPPRRLSGLLAAVCRRPSPPVPAASAAPLAADRTRSYRPATNTGSDHHHAVRASAGNVRMHTPA